MNSSDESSSAKGWGRVISTVLSRIGEQQVYMNAAVIQSIEPVAKILKVLGLPDYVQGVMDSKGTLLTMIDLTYVLTGTPLAASAFSRTLVVGWGGKKYGLMVNEASDFAQLEDEQIGEWDEQFPFLREVLVAAERDAAAEAQPSDDGDALIDEELSLADGETVADAEATADDAETANLDTAAANPDEPQTPLWVASDYRLLDLDALMRHLAAQG